VILTTTSVLGHIKINQFVPAVIIAIKRAIVSIGLDELNIVDCNYYLSNETRYFLLIGVFMFTPCNGQLPLD